MWLAVLIKLKSCFFFVFTGTKPAAKNSRAIGRDAIAIFDLLLVDIGSYLSG